MIQHEPTFYLEGSVDRAIERIRNFCPEEGYYLCCSFGKDSIVLLELAKMAGVKFDAHFHRSTVDPPELIRFGKENYPEVEIDKPPMSMFNLILEQGCPPLRRMRYCCRIFKEQHGSGRVILDGIRSSESEARRNRKLVDSCPSKANVMVHPILEWSEAEIWDFIHSYNIPYCKLYDEGFTRLGCIMCPNGYYKTRLKEAERWPRFFSAYMRCFDELAENPKKTWQSGDEVMRWWLEEKRWKAEDKEFYKLILTGGDRHGNTKAENN